MVTELKRNFSLSWDVFLFNLLSILGAFLFGVLLVVLIVRLGGETSWFSLGTVIAMGAMLMFTVIVGLTSYSVEFRICLSMGGTRRGFLMYYALRQVFTLALSYVLIRLLYIGECVLYGVIFPGLTNEAPFTFLSSIWCLPVLAGLGLLSMFLGALRAKFGNKGMAAFWLLWIFCCLILPRMFDRDDTSALGLAAGAVLTAILTVPPAAWAVFLSATAVAMIAAVIYWGMRQDV